MSFVLRRISAIAFLPFVMRVSSMEISDCLVAISLVRFAMAIFRPLILAWATLILAVRAAISLVNEALSFLVLLRVAVHSAISLLHTSSSCSSWVRLLPTIWSVQALWAEALSETIKKPRVNTKAKIVLSGLSWRGLFFRFAFISFDRFLFFTLLFYFYLRKINWFCCFFLLLFAWS